MKKSPILIVCDICGKKQARVRSTTQTYGKGSDLLVIENVPVISCRNCGESYFTAETLIQLDRIRRERKGVSKRRPVAVANFS